MINIVRKTACCSRVAVKNSFNRQKIVQFSKHHGGKEAAQEQHPTVMDDFKQLVIMTGVVIVGITGIVVAANALQLIPVRLIYIFAREKITPKFYELTPPQGEITQKVFMDFTFDHGGKEVTERIVIGLYGKNLPKLVENFKLSCAGDRYHTKTGKSLAYKGTKVSTLLVADYLKAGDFNPDEPQVYQASEHDKKVFERDEFLKFRHNGFGVVSLVTKAVDSNVTRFKIMFSDNVFMDRMYPVIGCVLEGAETLRHIEKLGGVDHINDEPRSPVVISDCGLLTLEGNPIEYVKKKKPVVSNYEEGTWFRWLGW